MMLQIALDLRAAAVAARERTGNPNIGTRVDAGRVQLITAAYDERGAATVTPLSDWLTPAEAVVALEQLGTVTLQAGQRVKFAAPLNAGEAANRFIVLEPRGDRVLVQLVCELTLKPTFVYRTADLIAV